MVDLVNNASSNFRFTIIILKNERPLEQEITRTDVRVVLVQKTGKISLGLFHELEETLAALKPDIVHTHLFGGDFWGRVAAKRLGLPVVTTEHNINIDESWMQRNIKKWLKHKTDVYTASSGAIRRYMKQTYGIAQQHITVTRFGIPLEKFSHIKPTRIRAPYELLIVGRLAKQKGHDIALRALKLLKKKKWKLEIIGSGALNLSLTQLVEQLNLEHQVQFAHPIYDVASVYERNQIVLVPSRWEGLGLVVMEAMASGRLVIAARTGGIPELVTHRKTGLLFEPNEITSLASQIEWAMEHSKEAETIAAAGRNYAMQHFGFEKTVREYETVYKELRNKRTRSKE